MKILAVALLLPLLLAPQVKNPQRIFQLAELKKVPLTVKGGKITAWVMDTPSKRNEGMMFLRDKEVKISEGMLFVFAEPQPLSFWMKNTFLPLDIAFIDKTGRILNVAQMKPLDESGTPSKGNAMFVLEMKKGAFQKFGIRAGQKLAIPKGIGAKS